MSNPQGIAFPFRFTNSGSVKKSSEVDKVIDNMRALAKTAVNERLIRKLVGTIGYSRVLRNLNNSTTLGAVGDLIKEALVRYEKRALILSVGIISEDTRDGMKHFISVNFIYKATGEQSSLTTQIA
jgi:phage baseplate assembly protein W